MARPKKEGLDYFPLDVVFFSDKKIKILSSKHGINGVAVYLYLLCEIYRNGYFIVFEEAYEYIIAKDLNIEKYEIEQIKSFLLKLSLFDKETYQNHGVLTSVGVQRRFQEAVKTRGKKNAISVKDFWLLTDEETQDFIKVQTNQKEPLQSFSRNNPSFSRNNPSFSRNNPSFSQEKSLKKSKVKKSKVKKREGTGKSPALGEYQNVKLTEKELETLKAEFPSSYEQTINNLSSYLERTGKEYNSHFATIRKWAKEDSAKEAKEAQKSIKNKDTRDYRATQEKMDLTNVFEL